MIALVGVTIGTVLLRVLGAMGGRWTSWRAAIVLPLALMYLLTGLAHFTAMGEDLAKFVPPGVPHPLALVRLAGAIQVIGGFGLLDRRWRAPAAVCLIALLLIKLPLNWLGATHGLRVRGPLPTPPMLRVPLVILWIAALAWIARGSHASADSLSNSTPSRS